MKDTLKNFFQEYPAISKQQFCREAGITTRSLYFYIEGTRNPKPATCTMLIQIMQKYGYKKGA